MSGHPTQENPLPITNTLFPPPPAYWQSFTETNIQRYESLTGTSFFDNQGDEVKQDINLDLGEDERKELEELKIRLNKPRNDWVEEDGRWMSFGTLFNIKPTIPSVKDIGLPPLFQSTTTPEESLPNLLSSFLHTILLLLDVLTTSARTPDELMHAGWAHEGDQYIQHLSNLAASMMIHSNSLRQMQSESTLILMMEKEREERRTQTEMLRRKCREISTNIRRLKEIEN
ncbi:hypothetical protein I204_05895 [Kwoniella mangroviensis CBS 8886]|uniref:uncharacterized protein n=1 Tax=Kwoniella mangroviensis CBS 8507 TaxID=1296122 RepID=UPI00080CCF76|nr:uncharacterized protein I203_07869 [Kwoniella mangroviensis CBS 8507]OCF63133.1 hypothetical protein I203_07869 [Kwoniella mangroviensis CBS 8507]OCF74045.1 hypothetical protein I204_05895 [Kwoniella mangroviensis CBS 8886]